MEITGYYVSFSVDLNVIGKARERHNAGIQMGL